MGEETKEWLVFTVDNIGANIQRKVGGTQRTVWVTLKSPETQQIKIAYQTYPGAGPQPEGTLTSEVIADIVHEIELQLEDALDRIEQKHQIEKLENTQEVGW